MGVFSELKSTAPAIKFYMEYFREFFKNQNAWLCGSLSVPFQEMWLPKLVRYSEGSYPVMLQGKHIKALVTYVAHTSKLHTFKGLTGANIPT